MAAPTTTDHIRDDSFLYTKTVHTAVFGSSQETTATKVDLSTLKFADTGEKCTIESLKWNISGAGVVNVLLAGGSPVSVAQLSGFGEIDGGSLAAAGGNVNFTTTGFASGDTYQIEIRLKKAAGFLLAPAAGTFTFDSTSSGPNFNVGDTITSTLAFTGPVLVTGTPEVQYILTSGTVLAECTNAPGSYASTLTFVYTVQAGDQSEAATMTVGTLVLNNAAKITGGLGNSAARITFSAPGTSTVTLNKKATATVTLVAGTGPAYSSGETVQFTVTYSKAVTVTGVPSFAIHITSGNKNATYKSGSGTTALTFSYTPVVSGDVSLAASVSVVSPISLNSGTIKDALGNAAILTFSAPSMSAVTFN